MSDRLKALIRALAHPYTGADQVAMETEARAIVASMKRHAETAPTPQACRLHGLAHEVAIHDLQVLVGEMKREWHHGLADIPVSVNLDDWIERLDRMLAVLEPGA